MWPCVPGARHSALVHNLDYKKGLVISSSHLSAITVLLSRLLHSHPNSGVAHADSRLNGSKDIGY